MSLGTDQSATWRARTVVAACSAPFAIGGVAVQLISRTAAAGPAVLAAAGVLLSLWALKTDPPAARAARTALWCAVLSLAVSLLFSGALMATTTEGQVTFEQDG